MYYDVKTNSWKSRPKTKRINYIQDENFGEGIDRQVNLKPLDIEESQESETTNGIGDIFWPM